MPKVLVFAACQKGSVDFETRLPNLIGVFHHFRVGVREGGASGAVTPEELAEGFQLSIPWSAVAYWMMTPEERNTEYLVRCEMYKPDGMLEERMSGEAAMSIGDGNRHASQFVYSGFLYTGPGTYTLRLSIRAVAGDAVWETAAEYPLLVTTESDS